MNPHKCLIQFLQNKLQAQKRRDFEAFGAVIENEALFEYKTYRDARRDVNSILVFFIFIIIVWMVA